MEEERKSRDSMSFFRFQWTTRGTSIINPWAPWILNEQVSFLLPIMTFLSYSLCCGHCECFLSFFFSSPIPRSHQHTFPQNTNLWNLASFPAFAVLIKSSSCLVTQREHSQQGARFPNMRHIQLTHQPFQTLCQTLRSQELRFSA